MPERDGPEGTRAGRKPKENAQPTSRNPGKKEDEAVMMNELSEPAAAVAAMVLAATAMPVQRWHTSGRDDRQHLMENALPPMRSFVWIYFRLFVCPS